MSSSTSTTHSKPPRYIVALFRRLFCSTTLPTCPSEHNHSTSSHTMDFEVLPPIPGLMARLMGLETMPPISITTRTPPSMNSLQPKCDPKKRVINTSVSSFRELPIFLEQEDNHEFFVISFEKSNSRSKNKLTKTTNDHLSTKRNIKYQASIQKENMTSCQFVDDQCKLNYSTRNHTEEKLSTRKMNNHHHIETGSEDSSPVSVFDFEEFLFHLEDAPISEVGSRVKDSNSKRKLLVELEDHDQPTSNSCRRKLKESRTKDDPRNQWKQICKLAHEDITETNWMYKDMGKLQETEDDITAGFEIEIVHHLLNEMVQQLVDQYLNL